MDNQDDIPRNGWYEESASMTIEEYNILRRHLAQIGRKGGSVKSQAKSEAAKLRNAKRKVEGKPECKGHKDGFANIAEP